MSYRLAVIDDGTDELVTELTIDDDQIDGSVIIQAQSAIDNHRLYADPPDDPDPFWNADCDEVEDWS